MGLISHCYDCSCLKGEFTDLVLTGAGTLALALAHVLAFGAMRAFDSCTRLFFLVWLSEEDWGYLLHHPVPEDEIYCDPFLPTPDL